VIGSSSGKLGEVSLAAALILVVIMSGALAGQRSPLTVLPDFRVDTVYEVPSEQGSWVALTSDPRGRLITSDQFGRLYRVSLPQGNGPLYVRPLSVEVGSAQGLLCAFDSLYVVVNRSPDLGGAGLFRLRDTDGDDNYDRVDELQAFEGQGEHGPHAIVMGRDGQSLYLVAGNATRLPSIRRSLVPPIWAPDALLPHLMQTDGVWRKDRPGGWVCRLDPSGQDWETVAVGFRNPYDIAFDADGELFTFDADMEWDLGTPWYRPTRVNHITSGSEFGWRTGSAKWPDTTLDSLGSVVDVGESSPTGMAFGYLAKFPARYQRALFLGDWSYGKIYALHLKPHGSSYTGTYEQFLAGMPLPVTDLVIHPLDGARYFTVGGRGTPSQLYRVSYVGSLPTTPVEAHQTDPDDARSERHTLEVFHGRRDPRAVETAWPYLKSQDRAIRFAARTAIEHQRRSEWQARALSETDPRTAMAALLALARCGDATVRGPLLEALARFDFSRLDPTEQSDCLRVTTVALCRLGEPTAEERRVLLDRLNPLFPAHRFELDRDLSTLLVFLRSHDIVERSLEAMDRALAQEEALHYALNLRTLPQTAWTQEDLERYLRWHNHTLASGGGVTFAEYLIAIRTQILDAQDAERRQALSGLINAPPPPSPLDQLKQRKFVREWTVDDLLPHLQVGLRKRSFEQGRTIFAQAMCLKCHRFRRQGGLTGPELTGAAARFDARTLLESILEPSKVISDQYSTINLITRDGEEHTGRIGDQTDEEVVLKFDLFNPANLLRIAYADIEKVELSNTSLMPTNLLDYFTEEEVLDLLAYIFSQGDPASSVFIP
jgi:putative heme-binding domain-containing protein